MMSPDISRKHWWFSGRILACHAGDPGPIPGQCNCFFSYNKIEVHIDETGFPNPDPQVTMPYIFPSSSTPDNCYQASEDLDEVLILNSSKCTGRRKCLKQEWTILVLEGHSPVYFR